MKMRVARFEELEVHQVAFALQQLLFELSKRWPREEQYVLTGQIQRASRSIGANIAEAWAKRRYEAHFVSKLTDADGELDETRHWLFTARACSYVDEDFFEE
jgi:four helix bundle protein